MACIPRRKHTQLHVPYEGVRHTACTAQDKSVHDLPFSTDATLLHISYEGETLPARHSVWARALGRVPSLGPWACRVCCACHVIMHSLIQCMIA